MILVTALALAGMALLSSCGQKGPLFIPNDAAARQRATLPQTVFGGAGKPQPPASAPATPALPIQPELPEIQ
ncbi:MAG: lipoprotein [Burkholderiaceae bacterium]|jgi:predicted small lipoprotein YifL|nr:lipoprotein [Burkholderiaceae bacterium]